MQNHREREIMDMRINDSSKLKTMRTEELVALVTCPICQKLQKQATSISECLHSFCKECIYKKILDENAKNCPVCDADLGAIPLQKLRPDFLLRTMKVHMLGVHKRTPEECAARRRSKEAAIAKGKGKLYPEEPEKITSVGRQKSVPKKFVGEKQLQELERSSSPVAQTKKPESSEQPRVSRKGKEKVIEPLEEMNDLREPLNRLVDGLHTRSRSRSRLLRLAPTPPPLSPPPQAVQEKKSSKAKGKNPIVQPVQRKEKVNATAFVPETESVQGNRRRRKEKNVVSPYKGTTFSLQDVAEAGLNFNPERKLELWANLVPSSKHQGTSPLHTLEGSYIRIKFGEEAPAHVSSVMKFLCSRLKLNREGELDLYLEDEHILPPNVELRHVVKLWLNMVGSSERQTIKIGGSAKAYVMKLAYARSSRAEKYPH